MPEDKTGKLDSILMDLKSFVVAFSGGVDSSFLLHRAGSLNLPGVMGVTIRTPYIPEIEINDAVDFTRKYGIKHTVIDLPFPESVRENPPERCYICKRSLFNELISFARTNGYDHVVDGTNADDAGEYRPGLKALAELSVRSPLMESGLTKADIREYSRRAGLPVWDKPAMACLLTRIPYNTVIQEGVLRMIEKAERFLFGNGFAGARVRIQGDLARIECDPDNFERLISKSEREHIISHLKEIGFRYITLDLEGYRTGSFKPEKKEI